MLAMHSQSLRLCPDIWQEICGHLYNSNSSGSLALLAAACKESSEPALDVLWREIPSILPFLTTFPDDCFRISGGKSSLPILRFTRKVITKDWDRISTIYAPRIRKVGFPQNTQHDFMVDNNTIDFIIPTIPKTRLLPNLADLCIRLTDSTPSFIYMRIIHPQMTALRMHVDKSSVCREAQSLISHMRDTCREMKTFSLEMPLNMSMGTLSGRPWIDMMAIANGTVSGLKQLTELTLTVVDDTSIPTLLELPDLQSLHLTVLQYGADSVTHSFLQTRKPKLPRLQHLQLITISSIPFYEDFMPCFQSLGNINTLSIETYWFGTIEFWLTLFQRVGKIHSLQSLAFVCSDVWSAPGSGFSFGLEILNPLYSIKGIKHFSLQTSRLPIRLNEGVLKHISQAWPQLRTLNMTASRSGGIPIFLPSSLDLKYLAYNCPDLSNVSFSMCMNAAFYRLEEHERIQEILAIPTPPHSTPIEFSFYYSRLYRDNSGLVADLLLHMFEKGSFGILPLDQAWKRVAEFCLRGSEAEGLTTSVRWDFDLDALVKRGEDEPEPPLPAFIQKHF